MGTRYNILIMTEIEEKELLSIIESLVEVVNTLQEKVDWLELKVNHLNDQNTS
jgi:hypothetical protein